MSIATRTLPLPRRRPGGQPPGMLRIIAALVRERRAGALPPSRPGIRRCYGWPCWLAMVLLGRRWARAICIVLAWRLIDDVHDGERPAPQGTTVDAYMKQFAGLTAALANGSEAATSDPLAEQVLRFALGIGRDEQAQVFAGWWQASWNSWTTQPARGDLSSGIRLATQLELDGLIHATAMANAVSYGALGGKAEDCVTFATMLMEYSVRLDALTDLAEDANGGHIWATKLQLLTGCVNPGEVGRCHSFQELLRIPGFTNWFRATARQLHRDMLDALAIAPAKHAAAMPSSTLNRWLLLAYLRHWTARKYFDALDSLTAA